MSRHNPFPAKKSRLPPIGKALAAVKAIRRAVDERMDEKSIQALLKEEVGLNWSLLTALQYLTGKQALGALEALPANWVGEDGTTMDDVEGAVAVAHLVCANLKPDARLSAGVLVEHFRDPSSRP